MQRPECFRELARQTIFFIFDTYTHILSAVCFASGRGAGIECPSLTEQHGRPVMNHVQGTQEGRRHRQEVITLIRLYPLDGRLTVNDVCITGKISWKLFVNPADYAAMFSGL